MPPGRIKDGQVLFFKREPCTHCHRGMCPTCGGTGKTVKNGLSAKCGECGGEGRCPKCFGTGKNHVDLLKLGEKALEEIRGQKISYISQEKMTALNPVLTIGRQVSETFLLHQEKELYRSALQNLEKMKGSFGAQMVLNRLHKRLLTSQLKNLEDPAKAKLARNINSLLLNLFCRIPVLGRYDKWLWREAKKKAVELLRITRMPKPETVIDMYPHELSGGMQQRVLIAIALACRPELVIADEPTTGLDVTIQAQILNLMKDLQKEFGSSVLLITHDLGVIAEFCDRVAIMYAGVVVEKGDIKEVFRTPIHPYTKGLMSTIPSVHQKKEHLNVIPGTVPNLIDPPSGCRFHPRCSYAMTICKEKKPKMSEQEIGHFVACHLCDSEG